MLSLWSARSSEIDEEPILTNLPAKAVSALRCDAPSFRSEVGEEEALAAHIWPLALKIFYANMT